ncbi:AMP-binding enzyme [Falsirhodobacter sp. 1013]|uniref:AMP-binding enzyme n=1 Tax=Falsirhodobacter sp. 1013 TaxID=3417566 RepID=UPI003EB7FC49
MFISGGENVYPVEVEVEAALSEDDTVREVAVIGVPFGTWGKVGCAFVVLAPDARPDSDLLLHHCAGRFAKYKLPKHFRFVATLPRTGSGKVMKHVLRQQYLSEA